MSEHYCRSCYRPISADGVLCSACDRSSRPRWPLVVGAAGFPLLIVGMLTLNVRLCMLGAAIAGIGILIYVISLR